MKASLLLIVLFVTGVTGGMNAAGQSTSPVASTVSGSGKIFEGPKTFWREGFDRYDFVMDTATLAITPIKAPQGENFAVGEPAKGQRRCVLVVPKKAAPGNPWSWRGCYWDHQSQVEVELLRRGFYIAYISASAVLRPSKEWDVWYAFLTEKCGLSTKPSFVGMSRGGEFSYIWATSHPDKVSCLYVDNPGMNREAMMKLDGLARNDVALLHVCGSIDPLLGPQTYVIENIYQQLGGRISLMIKDGFGHHPHSFRDPMPIADWIEANSKRLISDTPAFAGTTFIKTHYYSAANQYRDFPTEGTYMTCRGPWFSNSYDRYEFNIKGVAGSVVVTVPRKEVPGRPWVYRAGFAGRDAVVDLALLACGYHIITGPVSYNSDSLLIKDWNTTYQYFVDNGFSKTPVMEGAGRAAGEVYGWAINNPGKVSAIYAENPVLRTTFSVAQPLDHLDVLASAGVPLLHVCGSDDPGLADNTRAAEKKYKELGGSIKVIVKEGEGHYPLAPEDPEMIAELIVKGASRNGVGGARGAMEVGADGTTGGTRAEGAYGFDRIISRPVLENYLSRAITMQNLLIGQGDFEDNLRMLHSMGAKYIGRSVCQWGGEAHLLKNFEKEKELAVKVHQMNPDIVLEACIFEIVSRQINEVAVPGWAFTALGMPVAARNFRYDSMIYADGRMNNQWGNGASVPDVSRPETKLLFYYLAASYIDLGIEGIHFGQVELMNKNDPGLDHYAEILSLIRAYAVGHARRHMLLCNSHVPGGGFVRDGHLLMDFHAFPLRIMEVADTPQHAILQLGFSDGLYNRSKGGITYSGWTCDHLPYLVEFDNYGVSKHPGQPNPAGTGAGFDWIWGYDEISWFAHQTRAYRSEWLHYAIGWVKATDANAFLEMPGSRVESSPLDHKKWYYANSPGAAVPDGLGDEETIREIWAADKVAASGGRSSGKMARHAFSVGSVRGMPELSEVQPEEKCAAAEPGPGTLLAGTAKVNITPQSDEPLHDSVYARSLVLDVDGRRLAFVFVDLAVFTSDRLERICKEKYGVEELMICSSHNHSEPQKWGRSFAANNPYATFYEDRILQSIEMAVNHLFPARIAAGHRTFPPLGFNRLIIRDDGHARESWFSDDHYTSENPERIPFGPVDPEVGVIRIEDLAGNPRAVMMNYACHADIVCFNYAVSADYPGVACRKVEEAFGGKVNCLFVQGAGGNIESLQISSRRSGPNDPFQTDYAPMERTGTLLADEVIRLTKTLAPGGGDKTEIKYLEDSLQFTGRFDKTLHFNVHLSTIIINNNIVIAACPGELFVQLQLEWKNKIALAEGSPFLFGYTWSGGKWPGYVADVRSAALGGYGADQDPEIIEVGAGEAIMNRQLENYYRLNGLMRDKPGPSGFKAGSRWIITPVAPGK